MPNRHDAEADIHALRPAPSLSPATAAPVATPAPVAIATTPLPPSPVPAAPPDLADDPLPDRYGEDRVTLLVRDPNWLHAYWEITESGRRRALEVLGLESSWLTLRTHIYNAPEDEASSGFFDTELPHPDVRLAYVHGGRPGASFEVEIGFKTAGGRFVAVARSRRVTTPRDRVSDITDEEWTGIAYDERMMMGFLPADWRPGGGSLEIPALMAGAGLEMVGSGGVSSFSARRYQRPRAFWFVLETELIVHGATEPGAHVTCQGRPVALRPDGTFTLRFALPDGKQEIPCAATSTDHLETITITPRIEKRTDAAREERLAAFESPLPAPAHAPLAPDDAEESRRVPHRAAPHRGASHLVPR